MTLVMQVYNYSLKVGKRQLFKNVNIEFEKGHINHILGDNGVGKSCFAKSTIGLFNYTGNIKTMSPVCVIGSYTGIPQDLKLLDVVHALKLKFDNDYIEYLFTLLNMANIPNDICISNMSDGQKQKIKLLSFLSSAPEVIILDEFTSALDKTSTLDIYEFFNKYIDDKKVIINITHNLTDLERMPGNYYYINNMQISKIADKQTIFDLYIK